VETIEDPPTQIFRSLTESHKIRASYKEVEIDCAHLGAA
jgi:hypothetical protein